MRLAHFRYFALLLWVVAGGSLAQGEVYYVLMVRTGTPPDIASRLEGDLRKVMAMPDVASRIAAAGIDLFPKSAREMAAIMSADVARFREVIRQAGIRPE